MSEGKIHLLRVMLYESRKGVTVGIPVKNIQHVYQDRAPVLRIIEKFLYDFFDQNSWIILQ